ncbi:acyltransferase family protein [Hymenobacter chitinivorans]|uniref:Surface polysaccharide O-acyltransferase-like enzyme n=1 Tax=Hymenobacter chitinivorans DSM 11115 TaxID=1121954 RepID=A0A2M9BQP4_9BACT|nr:acyltransferase family protein [Hymenobacter chitinivorans]PJJ60247.1 surface polysaccharide O-acyltransferase-like enzyme [Hymenobacter chitinivorans DSM 11115]
MLSSPAALAPATRRYDLDWLRVLAFGLLIFYHTGMVFVGWNFHLMSQPSSPALELPMEFLNQWRMPLLFVISGVGISFALRHRTAGQFVGERLQRLLLPLAFGMVVVVVPQVYYERLSQGAAYASLLDFYPHYFEGTYPKGNFTWNHLWFIAYLLVFSLVSLPVFLLFRQAAGQAVLARLSQWLQRPGAVLLLALPLILLQLVLRPSWPDHRNLISDWFNFAFYLTLFVYGYLLGSLNGFWQAAERQRYWFLALGLLAFSFYYWADDYYYAQLGGAIKRGVQGLNCWCWILAVLGFGRRHLNRNSPLLQEANEAVYPFYILHQTVLIWLTYYVLPWPASNAAKFVLLSLGTFGVTLLLYLVIRQFALLRVLFGLKPRKQRRQATVPAPSVVHSNEVVASNG